MVWKNFHLWFSNLRCLPTLKPPSPPPPSATATTTTATADDFFSSDSATVPDFSAVFASHRFFFSSPGSSNSILDSPDTRPSSAAPLHVLKLSSDPYADFRLSMHEMIQATHHLIDVKSDWHFLQDLLLSYLHLNSIDTHKFIITAFSDLVLCLLESSETAADRRLRRSSSMSEWPKISSW